MKNLLATFIFFIIAGMLSNAVLAKELDKAEKIVEIIEETVTRIDEVIENLEASAKNENLNQEVVKAVATLEIVDAFKDCRREQIKAEIKNEQLPCLKIIKERIAKMATDKTSGMSNSAYEKLKNIKKFILGIIDTVNHGVERG
jgi:hypothetical protein